MKKFIKRVITFFIQPAVINYLSYPRMYRYQRVSIKIFPGVFHHGFFFSTKFLLQFILQYDLKGKKILEPGAGSGLISFVSERAGAIVTASELSEAAISGLEYNKEKLHSNTTIIRSDLFEKIPEEHFDFIIINPPYYPKNPLTESQLAWHCGEGHEYFEKLFSQLSSRISSFSKIVMVLSEDCDTLTIEKIAAHHGFELTECDRKKFWWEWNYIFEITNQEHTHS